MLFATSQVFSQDMNMNGMNMPETKQEDSFYYTCVMHPEIHAAQPGNCPKCGMKLIKKKVAATKKVIDAKKEKIGRAHV